MVPGFRALPLVSVLTASGAALAAGPDGNPAAAEPPAARPRRDAIPLYPVMPEPHIETFPASTMIMGTFGRYLSRTAHDHETARA